jgi:two-component system response regulator HydG
MKQPYEAPRVLVVDDNLAMAEMIVDGLDDGGFSGVATSSSRKALALLGDEPFDALVTDLRMPDVDGLGLLAASREADPTRPVIVMTGYGAVDSAVESIRQGAFHYLTKPFKTEELILFLRRALEQRDLRRETVELKRALRAGRPHATILGQSKAIRALVEQVRRVADVSTPVLVVGETGTGKGLVARALHDESSRAGRPFVTVNCAAIPEALLESELFGHVKGAFTGAVANKTGLFVEADGGTLLLDEIGDMPLALQAKLLDVLGRGVVRPVGGNREQPVGARIVAATHRDLRARGREGTFREDLYFRLGVVTLEVPALRNRPEDLPLLIEHFFTRLRERHAGRSALSIGREATEALLSYGWPGNVRELEHVLERAVLLASGPEITPGDLPSYLVSGVRTGGAAFTGEVVPLREVSRAYAAWAFEASGRQRARTAERLGIDPKTLDKLLAPLVWMPFGRRRNRRQATGNRECAGRPAGGSR